MNNLTKTINITATTFALLSSNVTTPLVADYLPNTEKYNINEKGFTCTISSRIVSERSPLNFQEASSIFSYKMKDFNNEELKRYKESIRKIYKPIGVNVIDLC